ncbi:hypothetical protein [Georgenia yuyongxinii]
MSHSHAHLKYRRRPTVASATVRLAEIVGGAEVLLPAARAIRVDAVTQSEGVFS